MTSWLEPAHAEDMVFENDCVYDILRSKWNSLRDHEPLAVINDRRQIQSVVCLSDSLAYVAAQMEVVHHLWPSLTVVVAETSWPSLRNSVLEMPIGQFSRSRRGIVLMPTDWAHAVRLLSRSSRSALFVQDRRRTLVGKITWTSLRRHRNLLEEPDEDDHSYFRRIARYDSAGSIQDSKHG